MVGSAARTWRVVPVLIVMAGLLTVVVVASVALGSRPVPFDTAARVLLSPDGSPDAIVVHELRLPRTVVGILVGVALGVAGVVMQALTRNPLADPGLLGVNSGAAAAVVLAISFLGVDTAGGYVWFAFVGAALAAVVVLAVGSARYRSNDPVSLVLAGVAVSACLGAVVGILTMFDSSTFESFRFWVVGSLERRDLAVAVQVLPFVLSGLLGAVLVSPGLNALALGDELGRSLGTRPGLLRGAGLLAITLLCGAATAAAGPIAFVGLMVPHVVRPLVGPDVRMAVPVSALVGAVLVVGSDVVGRVVVRPGELEVGVVTAFLGAPVLFWLATRSKGVRR